MEAFVYCWTDHLTGKLYIGSHRGNEDDGYVCSSKPMMIEYKIRPNDFTRQIIAHGTTEDARELEHQILIATKAANSDDFYNVSHGGGRLYRKGVTMTEEHKQKISTSNKGKAKSDSHKAALKRAKSRLSEETKSKVGKAGGKASGERWATDLKLKQAQSVRIKQWWVDRKEKASVGK
jgi:hypothetical protein